MDLNKYRICKIFAFAMLLMNLRLATANNIDCDGKPFHCANSTHFMICVDLGAGVSKTVDGFVIQCPAMTECNRKNMFECEYRLPTTTQSNIRPNDETTLLTNYKQTTTISSNDITATVSPFAKTSTTGFIDEYINTIEVTTNANYVSDVQTYKNNEILGKTGTVNLRYTTYDKQLPVYNHTKLLTTTTESNAIENVDYLAINKPNNNEFLKLVIPSKKSFVANTSFGIGNGTNAINGMDTETDLFLIKSLNTLHYTTPQNGFKNTYKLMGPVNNTNRNKNTEVAEKKNSDTTSTLQNVDTTQTTPLSLYPSILDNIYFENLTSTTENIKTKLKLYQTGQILQDTLVERLHPFFNLNQNKNLGEPKDNTSEISFFGGTDSSISIGTSTTTENKIELSTDLDLIGQLAQEKAINTPAYELKVSDITENYDFVPQSFTSGTPVTPTSIEYTLETKQTIVATTEINDIFKRNRTLPVGGFPPKINNSKNIQNIDPYNVTSKSTINEIRLQSFDYLLQSNNATTILGVDSTGKDLQKIVTESFSLQEKYVNTESLNVLFEVTPTLMTDNGIHSTGKKLQEIVTKSLFTPSQGKYVNTESPNVQFEATSTLMTDTGIITTGEKIQEIVTDSLFTSSQGKYVNTESPNVQFEATSTLMTDTGINTTGEKIQEIVTDSLFTSSQGKYVNTESPNVQFEATSTLMTDNEIGTTGEKIQEIVTESLFTSSQGKYINTESPNVLFEEASTLMTENLNHIFSNSVYQTTTPKISLLKQKPYENTLYITPLHVEHVSEVPILANVPATTAKALHFTSTAKPTSALDSAAEPIGFATKQKETLRTTSLSSNNVNEEILQNENEKKSPSDVGTTSSVFNLLLLDYDIPNAKNNTELEMTTPLLKLEITTFNLGESPEVKVTENSRTFQSNTEWSIQERDVSQISSLVTKKPYKRVSSVEVENKTLIFDSNLKEQTTQDINLNTLTPHEQHMIDIFPINITIMNTEIPYLPAKFLSNNFTDNSSRTIFKQASVNQLPSRREIFESTTLLYTNDNGKLLLQNNNAKDISPGQAADSLKLKQQEFRIFDKEKNVINKTTPRLNSVESKLESNTETPMERIIYGTNVENIKLFTNLAKNNNYNKESLITTLQNYPTLNVGNFGSNININESISITTESNMTARFNNVSDFEITQYALFKDPLPENSLIMNTTPLLQNVFNNKTRWTSTENKDIDQIIWENKKINTTNEIYYTGQDTTKLNMENIDIKIDATEVTIQSQQRLNDTSEFTLEDQINHSTEKADWIHNFTNTEEFDTYQLITPSISAFSQTTDSISNVDDILNKYNQNTTKYSNIISTETPVMSKTTGNKKKKNIFVEISDNNKDQGHFEYIYDKALEDKSSSITTKIVPLINEVSTIHLSLSEDSLKDNFLLNKTLTILKNMKPNQDVEGDGSTLNIFQSTEMPTGIVDNLSTISSVTWKIKPTNNCTNNSSQSKYIPPVEYNDHLLNISDTVTTTAISDSNVNVLHTYINSNNTSNNIPKKNNQLNDSNKDRISNKRSVIVNAETSLYDLTFIEKTKIVYNDRPMNHQNLFTTKLALNATITNTSNWNGMESGRKQNISDKHNSTRIIINNNSNSTTNKLIGDLNLVTTESDLSIGLALPENVNKDSLIAKLTQTLRKYDPYVRTTHGSKVEATYNTIRKGDTLTLSTITSPVNKRVIAKLNSKSWNIPNVSMKFNQSFTNITPFRCNNRLRGRFADNSNCSKYYICFGKSYPVLGECPSNTVFSEIKKQCTKNLSHCIRNNKFHCIEDGRFIDVLRNNIYYICVKKNNSYVSFQFKCQNGFQLNKTSVTCMRHTELKTPMSSVSMDTDSNKESNQSRVEHISITKKVPNSPSKYYCTAEGKFPDKEDCRRYYVCSKNSKSVFRRRTKKCDSDEVFHREKKKCVDRDNYKCN